MSVISDFLKQILTAYYGKDVRQSIHDAIKQCYDDATGNPESVAAVVEQNDKMKELLENTPYTTVESEGEFELPVHTINDSKISDDSTWSSKKIIDAIYPIGSIYMSVNNVNPSELLGGTWVEWGAGRVPVGVGTGNDEVTEMSIQNSDETGGYYKQYLTTDSILWHRHTIKYTAGSFVEDNSGSGNGIASLSGFNDAYTKEVGEQGANIDIMQPWISCYMWKRTA